jgi:hypothetical protein
MVIDSGQRLMEVSCKSSAFETEVYSKEGIWKKAKTREIMSQPGTDNVGCEGISEHVQNAVPVKAVSAKAGS